MSFLIEQPLFAAVNATANGDNVVISGVAGRQIMVLGYMLTGTTLSTVTIQDTNGTPVVLGYVRVGADGGGACYPGPTPAFVTNAGEGVEINNATGNDTLGHMTYRVIG